MGDVRITEDMWLANTPIPVDQSPGRYAVATNLLCTVHDARSGRKGLIVLNYEPTKWNRWYPFYSTINNRWDFAGRRLADLRDEFLTVLCKEIGTTDARLSKARNEFENLYGCGAVSIADTPLVEQEHWLRYSKTADVWTYYLVEFYCITGVERPPQLLKQTAVPQALLPLGRDTLPELLASGRLLGVPVVDNVLALLSQDAVLEKLEAMAVTVL